MYTIVYTHTHTYIYICICVCVCVCENIFVDGSKGERNILK